MHNGEPTNSNNLGNENANMYMCSVLNVLELELVINSLNFIVLRAPHIGAKNYFRKVEIAFHSKINGIHQLICQYYFYHLMVFHTT
jgi:hypothetical protein